MKYLSYFFSSFFPTLFSSFTLFGGVPHILAIVLTGMLVVTGSDWSYFVHTRAPQLTHIFFPAVIVGGILPLILPFLTFLFGVFRKKSFYQVLGVALFHAMILGSCISSLYKAFTGRTQPNLHNVTDNISSAFHFGFLERGIFFGWPSSHTTIAFAMAITLLFFYSKNRKVKVVALLYALYIGVGVSFSIHWFSEFVAGALIGSVIGVAVGERYVKILKEEESV